MNATALQRVEVDASGTVVGAREYAAEAGNNLSRLFQILKQAIGVDFSGYKPGTVNRRIRRRMASKRIASLCEYVDYLRDHPDEVETLYQDLLIPVTSFFRDPQAFAALAKIAFPVLFKNRAPNDTIRVWVPGCSTGEEAYSHAICLVEYMSQMGVQAPLQVFATDVNEAAITKARAGIFKKNISHDVSPMRLRRFFAKADAGYKISKTIRGLCIFARQNLLADPPFSKMDIVSCRNVLIYLGEEMQARAIAALHFALKPHGYLMLGSAEGLLGKDATLFEAVDAHNRIYRKNPVASLLKLPLAIEPFDIQRGQ